MYVCMYVCWLVGWLVGFYSKLTLVLFYAEDFLFHSFGKCILERIRLVSTQISVSTDSLNIPVPGYLFVGEIYASESLIYRRFFQKVDYVIIFTQPLRSGRIWHKVNFKV